MHHLDPYPHGTLSHLRMPLQRQTMVTDRKRLVRADITRKQGHGPFWQGERFAMPMKAFKPFWKIVQPVTID